MSVTNNHNPQFSGTVDAKGGFTVNGVATDGDVSRVGTPAVNQIPTFNAAGNILGDVGFTRTSTDYTLNQQTTGGVVLKNTSSDLLGRGFGLKGTAELYIKNLKPDINTGFLIGDLTPLGLSDNSLRIGASDFSDNGDQGSAFSNYVNDQGGSTFYIYSEAKDELKNGYNMTLSHEGYGVRRIVAGTGSTVFSINSAGVTIAGDSLIIATAKTPASATATGTAGQKAWDANYEYTCISTNVWKRVAIATW